MNLVFQLDAGTNWHNSRWHRACQEETVWTKALFAWRNWMDSFNYIWETMDACAFPPYLASFLGSLICETICCGMAFQYRIMSLLEFLLYLHLGIAISFDIDIIRRINLDFNISFSHDSSWYSIFLIKNPVSVGIIFGNCWLDF